MSMPTVGRIVHYRSRGSADGVFPGECRAAVVTEVKPSGALRQLVSLAVLNPTGLFFDEDVEIGAATDGGTWHWPCVRSES